MKCTQLKLRTTASVLALAALPLAINQALAAEYWLQTGTTTVQGVPMWGYASCTASFASCGPVSVPGPALTVLPNDPGLTVHLKNTLGAPTSLVIPGQSIANPTPVWTDGTSGARGSDLSKRVRSFTQEAASGGAADYTWASLKPGTYLYQSGTEPQVQVQMGLYGAVTKDAEAGNVAYRQGPNVVAYANQATLLYSEVDPALHAAVSSGTYGTASGPTSTLVYQPKFFLINGVPYPDATLTPIATVPAAQATLLRFLNAGLKTHVPTINGQYWRMIAEDGNPYPYLNNPRQQYTAFLTAGKTMDVLLTPSNPNASGNVRHAIFDSRAFDTSNGAPGGGMLAYLDVTPATAAAPVFDSAPVLSATVGVAYSYAAHATDPNGDVVAYSLNGPIPAGMLINGTSGLISWTPPSAATYPVSVRASDGALFNDQTFNVVVAPATPTNNPPTARADSYTAIAHPSTGPTQIVAAPGVLANDSDPDNGNTLTAVNKSGSSRVTLTANGGFTLAGAGTGSGTTGSVTFSYQARDSSGAANNTSAVANVSINVIANRRPVTVADTLTAPRCTVRVNTSTACLTTGAGAYVPPTLNLTNNDTDPDTATIDTANQLPLSVARVRAGGSGNGITSGTLTTNSGGRVSFTGTTASGIKVTYTPLYNFAGTDTFQYRVKDKLGLEAGTNNAGWATVTITVQ